MDLLSGVTLLQVATDDGSAVARKAIAMAGQMARQLGAQVFQDSHYESIDDFVGRGKHAWERSAQDWLSENPGGVLLVAEGATSYSMAEDCSAVVYKADVLANEATLFGESGLAYLLGDPDRAPLIPNGNYGAGTTAYGVLGALCALVAKLRRFGEPDVARIHGAEVLSWVNWKAAIAASLGTDMKRQGDKAEWPVVPCADGYVALVYQERDWDSLVEMVGDERLRGSVFNAKEPGQKGREECIGVVREWMLGKTKRELSSLFEQYQIPATPVMTTRDLLEDPLLAFRNAFNKELRPDGAACQSPRLPHRIEAASGRASTTNKIGDGRLPLSGFRVLDLGIITAGAGVSALLADLGAEVLKVESDVYPDPFRSWAGAAVSPFFKGNNRNKFAISINLKSEEGKEQFRELVKTADVVVENYRRGVLDRLGFTYDALREINPDIILSSVSGQGLEGPGTSQSSFGSTLEGSSGFAANIHYADGLPYITGLNVNYPDQTVVLYAVAVLTAALTTKERGMNLDVSQRDVAVYLAGEDLEVTSSGQEAADHDNGRAYRTRDGVWLLFDDTQPVPSAAGEDLHQWVQGATAEEVITHLRVDGIGASIARSSVDMLQAFTDVQSSVFANSPNGDVVKGFPFQLDRTPMEILRDSPEVGQHTADYL